MKSFLQYGFIFILSAAAGAFSTPLLTEKFLTDSPPSLSWQAAPSITPQGYLRLDYTAHDDKALVSLKAFVTAGKETIEIDLPFPGRKGIFSLHDLSDTLLAGREVSIILSATDSAGQTTTTLPAQVTLSRRNFSNPLAQRIIMERLALMLAKAPSLRPAAERLMLLARMPAAYNGDLIMFMGLTTAAKRLAYDGSSLAINTTIDLLWDLALRVEDGGFSLAARDALASVQDLSSALYRADIPLQEKERLGQRMHAALYAYNRALQKAMYAQSKTLKPDDLAAELSQRLDMAEILAQIENTTRIKSNNDPGLILSHIQLMIAGITPKTLQDLHARQEQALSVLDDLRQITELVQQDDVTPLLLVRFDRLRTQIEDMNFQPPESLHQARIELLQSRTDLAAQHLSKALEQLMTSIAGTLREQIIALGNNN